MDYSSPLEIAEITHTEFGHWGARRGDRESAELALSAGTPPRARGRRGERQSRHRQETGHGSTVAVAAVSPPRVPRGPEPARCRTRSLVDLGLALGQNAQQNKRHKHFAHSTHPTLMPQQPESPPDHPNPTTRNHHATRNQRCPLPRACTTTAYRQSHVGLTTPQKSLIWWHKPCRGAQHVVSRCRSRPARPSRPLRPVSRGSQIRAQVGLARAT